MRERTMWPSNLPPPLSLQRLGAQVVHWWLMFHATSIIFIHGLTGDRERTWTAKNAPLPWIKTLLPTEIPNVRILTFGYDAYVANWRGMVSKNRVGNHSMNLITAVAAYRENDNTVN